MRTQHIDADQYARIESTMLENAELAVATRALAHAARIIGDVDAAEALTHRAARAEAKAQTGRQTLARFVTPFRRAS